jgi:hypothetical protein
MTAADQPSRTIRLLPPLLCLLYPLLVWSVSAISAAALPLTLAPTVVAVFYLMRYAVDGTFPRATGIAYFAAGSPALYTFLGGWLDFQSSVPFRANSVWIVLWTLLAILVAAEKPAQRPQHIDHSQVLPFAHGLSAAGISLFAAFHMTNHLAGLAGGQAHLTVMQSFRKVYRIPALELLLGTLILFQVLSGIYLLFRRKTARDRFEVLQGASGAYVALFFASHLSAVIRTRYLQHVDTNWIWLTSANLLKDAWSSRLVPYYFLGIVALGTHGSCGLRAVLIKHNKPKLAAFFFWSVSAAAILVASAIMFGLVRASLSGTSQPSY